MFINFWYVAEESKNVTDRPVHVQMLSQDFVLYRDGSGQAHCLSNVCIHRGGSLAGGKVKDDCIECPYHGWQFDSDGMCRRIPSMGSDAVILSRAKIDAYPTVEKYGLVFVFLGDLPEEDRPPIMEIAEWDRDGWRPTFLRFEWDFDYQRSLENGLDPGHNEFVHTTHVHTEGDQSFTIPPLDYNETDWGAGLTLIMPAPIQSEEKMREVSGRNAPSDFQVSAGHHGISSFYTFLDPSPHFQRHQYFYETPIHPGRTRIFAFNVRNAMLDAADDEHIIQMDTMVAKQDRDVLLNLRPVRSPPTNNKEIFVPADEIVARYRAFVREWEGRGWRINVDKANKDSARVAYAIPSPARRKTKGWGPTSGTDVTGPDCLRLPAR